MIWIICNRKVLLWTVLFATGQFIWMIRIICNRKVVVLVHPFCNRPVHLDDPDHLPKDISIRSLLSMRYIPNNHKAFSQYWPLFCPVLQGSEATFGKKVGRNIDDIDSQTLTLQSGHFCNRFFLFLIPTLPFNLNLDKHFPQNFDFDMELRSCKWSKNGWLE